MATSWRWCGSDEVVSGERRWRRCLIRSHRSTLWVPVAPVTPPPQPGTGDWCPRKLSGRQPTDGGYQTAGVPALL